MIQSISSSKAKSFKLCLAEVGRERLQAIDPELTIKRALKVYLKKAAQLNQAVTDTIEGATAEQDEDTEPDAKN